MAFHAWPRRVALLLASAAAFVAGPPAWADEGAADESAGSPGSYELGKGYRLGDSGFTVGGYSAAEYQARPAATAGASLTHLSMFLWWEGASRLKFFSEFDDEREIVASRGQANPTERHFLAIERFYFDYSFSDLFTLRAGKFLTPVGRWNLVHADPLVWTTSRPLITHQLFPDNITGLMLLGSAPMLGRQADYAIYASSTHDLRTAPGSDPFDRAYGGRINLPLSENLEVGASYLSYSQRAEPNEHKHLAGFDFLWSVNGYELSGELAQRRSSEAGEPDDRRSGAFLQAVVPLSDRLFAVGRVESLTEPDNAGTTRLQILGVNYRPGRALSLKLEYIRASNAGVTTPVGFLSSVSVLF